MPTTVPAIISIFNGFPFHFEVFGVFLNYIYTYISTPCVVRIYTNLDDRLRWLDFYKTKYPALEIFPHSEFSDSVFNESSYIILGTDDDKSFSPTFVKLPNANKKLICYDHHISLRAPHIYHHITTRPFPHDMMRKSTPYIYPVYPMISLAEKQTVLDAEETINIIVVGGTYNTNHYWRYLMKSNNLNDGRIRIFYIHRHCPAVWAKMDKYVKSICVKTELCEECETERMYSLLKRSHYMLILTDSDNFVHQSCSGTIGLAFSTGCRLIMPRIYNTDYQFRSVLYYEDEPVLTPSSSTLDLVFEEQEAIHAHNCGVLSSYLDLTE
jgi:hypothetical protein